MSRSRKMRSSTSDTCVCVIISSACTQVCYLGTVRGLEVIVRLIAAGRRYTCAVLAAERETTWVGEVIVVAVVGIEAAFAQAHALTTKPYACLHRHCRHPWFRWDW